MVLFSVAKGFGVILRGIQVFNPVIASFNKFENKLINWRKNFGYKRFLLITLVSLVNFNVNAFETEFNNQIKPESINTNNLNSEADWTLFIYMESDKDLNDAAMKNMADIARAGVPGNINVVVQLHAWQEIAWRYRISGNSITLDSTVDLTLDPEQDLFNGLSWAFKKHPSKKTMTVLWNHGFGILDPVWSEHDERWLSENLQDMKITRSKLLPDIFEHKKHRGVLFYPYTKVFLTNSGMVNVFLRVKSEVFNSKKINIISFDACRMAMVEIGYQLSGFANFLIGSQDCELKDGCDYFSLIRNLSCNYSPVEIAKFVVKDYENYYKPRAACGRYTQSAIDLNYIDELILNLDNLINALNLIKDSENSENKNKSICEIVRNVRRNMPEFCSMPSYIDIYSFLIALKDEFVLANLANILEYIDESLLSLSKVVIENVSGFKSGHAYGLSIYYPYDYKKCSYANCMFATKTLWLSFLQKFSNSSCID